MEGLELQGDNETATQSLQRVQSLRFWYLALVLNPLYVLGVLGNVISIGVFVRLARQSRPCSLLLWLALADASYLLFMFEYTGPAWGLPLLEQRSNLSCALLFYLRGVAGTAASLLLVAVCGARLALSVGAPKLQGWSSGVAVLAAGFLALGANVPRLVSFRLRGGTVPCRSHHESMIFTVLHMVTHLLVQRLGPALFTALLSGLLLLRIRQVMSPLHRHLRQQIRLTKACVVLGAAYALFFIPPGIYWCLIYYWEISQSASAHFLHYHAVVGDMMSVTAALNSAINFPVYLLFLEDFRRNLRRCFWRRKSERRSSSSTSLELRTIIGPEEER